MTYNQWNEIWGYSVIIGVLIWAFLAIRLFIGLLKKKGTIKSSIKYIINTSTFLFVAYAFFSFAITNTRPEENVWVWAKPYSIELFGKAISVALLLAIFNYLYQIFIEKKRNILELIVLAIVDLIIMTYGILLGIGIVLS